MTISKERLNILQQTFKATAKTSETLEAAALNDAAAAISELLAVREAQPVASTTKSNIDAVLSGVSTVIWPVRCFKGKTHADLYTAPPAPAVPAGFKLMPIDMTDQIGEAIAMEANCCGGIALDIYNAALAAAPTPTK